MGTTYYGSRLLILFYFIIVPSIGIYVINDPSCTQRFPSSANSVGVIDILDELYVSFTISINSFTSSTQYASILHLGDTLNENYPAIYVDTISHVFRVEFNSVSDKNQYVSSPSIQLSTNYNIEFTATHTSVLWKVNGITIINTTITSHSVLFDRNIYIGNPWNDPLDSVITQLIITTSISAIPFNYLCDYNNRFSVYSGTWSYDPGPCRLTSTDYTNDNAIVWMYPADTTTLEWSDYTVEIKFMCTLDPNLTGYPDIRILFRAQESIGNEYQLFAEVNNAQVSMREFQGGIEWQNVHTQYSNLLLENVLYTMRINAIANTFKFYLDDNLIFTTSDPTWTKGSIGIKTFTAQVVFHSLTITFLDNGQLYTATPSYAPTTPPSVVPSVSPTISPTTTPTQPPSTMPTLSPSVPPSVTPTQPPSLIPSVAPSVSPSIIPTQSPSLIPSLSPIIPPTTAPYINPTSSPVLHPTDAPSLSPIASPTTSPITPTDQQSGEIDDTTTTEGIQSTRANGKKAETDTNFFQGNMLIILIGIVSIVICCCLLLLIYGIRKQRKMKSMMHDIKEHVQNTNTTQGSKVELTTKGIELQPTTRGSGSVKSSEFQDDDAKRDGGVDFDTININSDTADLPNDHEYHNNNNNNNNGIQVSNNNINPLAIAVPNVNDDFYHRGNVTAGMSVPDHSQNVTPTEDDDDDDDDMNDMYAPRKGTKGNDDNIMTPDGNQQIDRRHTPGLGDDIDYVTPL